MTDISEKIFREFMGQVREHIAKALAFTRPLIRGDQSVELLILALYLEKAKRIADSLSRDK